MELNFKMEKDVVSGKAVTPQVTPNNQKTVNENEYSIVNEGKASVLFPGECSFRLIFA